MKLITMPAELDSIPALTEQVDIFLEEAECPMKAQMQLDIAIDEIFSNIAHYAYGADRGMADVQIERVTDPDGVIIRFMDSGQPYNPLLHENPDITLSAEERDIGGLGIFMVKKTMDGMEYEFKDNKNILTIRKNF